MSTYIKSECYYYGILIQIDDICLRARAADVDVCVVYEYSYDIEAER
jgi:hypothetical protein